MGAGTEKKQRPRAGCPHNLSSQPDPVYTGAEHGGTSQPAAHALLLFLCDFLWLRGCQRPKDGCLPRCRSFHRSGTGGAVGIEFCSLSLSKNRLAAGQRLPYP